MMGFGFLWAVFFWGLVLVLVGGGAAWLFAQIADERRQGDTHPRTARQVLDERLARGEVDQQEYAAVRSQIERQGE